jgi:4-amino-4-deoxy-L-arabinose transferase-like glycosyltransferase
MASARAGRAIPGSCDRLPILSRRQEWILLAAAVCVGLGLRLWHLSRVPPGLTHDEAAHGHDALRIVEGARPIYQTVGYGREPLYDYVLALALGAGMPPHYVTLRATSVVFGVASVLIAYLWVRRAFGPEVAILTAAWFAVSFWGVASSRQVLRSVMLPALFGVAVYAWWRGAYDAVGGGTSLIWFALSGIATAAALWLYMAARALWTFLVFLPLHLSVTDGTRLRRRWAGMLVAVAVALGAASPLFFWLWNHPGAEQRFSQLGQPLQSLLSGDPRQALANSVEALGMFSFRGDDLAMYNIPGRPWLGPLESILFYPGVVISVLRWRRPEYFAAVLWLLLGISPSLATGVSASATRSVAILPVLYLFSAVSLRDGLLLLRIARRRARQAVSATVLLIVLAGGFRTYGDYFGKWAGDRDVRVAYHIALSEIADYLDRSPVPSGANVVVSSIFPGRYHDPHVMDLLLQRSDLDLRWMDGRGSLVFPLAEHNSSYLVVPSIAPISARLKEVLDPPVAVLVESRRLRPDDLVSGFSVFAWDSRMALGQLIADAKHCSVVIRQAEQRLQNNSALGEARLPLDLGHLAELAGCEVSCERASSAYVLEVVTYWRVIARPDPSLDTVLFSHLLAGRGSGAILAQEDRLDLPAWDWRPGEYFAQVHRLLAPDESRAGPYQIAVGAYSRSRPSPMEPNPPVTRWAVYVDNRPVADHLLLHITCPDTRGGLR